MDVESSRTHSQPCLSQEVFKNKTKQTNLPPTTNKPTKKDKASPAPNKQTVKSQVGEKKTRKKEMKIKGRVDAGDDPVWTAVLPRSSLPAQILMPVHMLRCLS